MHDTHTHRHTHTHTYIHRGAATYGPKDFNKTRLIFFSRACPRLFLHAHLFCNACVGFTESTVGGETAEKIDVQTQTERIFFRNENKTASAGPKEWEEEGEREGAV